MATNIFVGRVIDIPLQFAARLDDIRIIIVADERIEVEALVVPLVAQRELVLEHGRQVWISDGNEHAVRRRIVRIQIGGGWRMAVSASIEPKHAVRGKLISQ